MGYKKENIKEITILKKIKTIKIERPCLGTLNQGLSKICLFHNA